MDAWGWEQRQPWLAARVELPIGTLFCVIDGPTRGRPWSSANVCVEFRRLAAQAGIRRRFAPHQLRHAHAVELAREGVALNVIQRQLGHANLGTTSIYLQGIARRDHRHRPRQARADDVRHGRPATLSSFPKTASAGARTAPAVRLSGSPLRGPSDRLKDSAAPSVRARTSSNAGATWPGTRAFASGRKRAQGRDAVSSPAPWMPVGPVPCLWRKARRSRWTGRDLASLSRGSPEQTRMGGSLCPTAAAL
jgi:hypothetical protein